MCIIASPWCLCASVCMRPFRPRPPRHPVALAPASPLTPHANLPPVPSHLRGPWAPALPCTALPCSLCMVHHCTPGARARVQHCTLITLPLPTHPPPTPTATANPPHPHQQVRDDQVWQVAIPIVGALVLAGAVIGRWRWRWRWRVRFRPMLACAHHLRHCTLRSVVQCAPPLPPLHGVCTDAWVHAPACANAPPPPLRTHSQWLA